MSMIDLVTQSCMSVTAQQNTRSQTMRSHKGWPEINITGTEVGLAQNDRELVRNQSDCAFHLRWRAFELHPLHRHSSGRVGPLLDYAS